ncbi:hypothetical protein E3G70_000058 [Mycobacteroides abscessus]|uniref:hypothetical protein n=1 Tax=Mycobacteroides abscessus TaxID=36809 RepID=UPI0013F60312|nr:hypothetical protein [Mycobacteroides abscessus]MBE5462798.1 hypothetical protein [Mycobacteroides abscessus]QOF45748.1 hypothetical protein E3G70_000058 [Mycobacteroides abscessus]
MTPASAGAVPDHLVPAVLFGEGIDRGRLAVLRCCRLRVVESTLHDAVVEAAALVWVRTPPRSVDGDRRAMSILAGMLLDDSEVFGGVDVRRSLRREAVDRWLARTGKQRKEGSARTYRTTLYTAGRVLYPREYPLLQTVSAPRTAGRPAADPKQVLAAYGVARTLPRAMGRRVVLILDMCGGAGLHADELRALRGIDIRPLDVGDQQVAVVCIADDAGEAVAREVPVVAPGRAQRILAAALKAGPGPVLGLGVRDSVGKNIVNAPMAKLRDQGISGISPEALRNRWILDLASRVPAAVMLSMVGVRDLRVLSDQRNQLVLPKTVEAVRILQEVGL